MAPKIATASEQGLSFQNVFGQLGPEHFVTIHHAAGPKDRDDAHARELNRRYHAEHRAKGWGGVAYHFNISRKGTIYCLRPTLLKGAHVGGHNSRNVGVLFHGTTGDRPTQAQLDSFLWLLRHAHTSEMPRAHRTDRDLRSSQGTRRLGHNDWQDHGSNACPGTHKPLVRLNLR